MSRVTFTQAHADKQQEQAMVSQRTYWLEASAETVHQGDQGASHGAKEEPSGLGAMWGVVAPQWSRVQESLREVGLCGRCTAAWTVKWILSLWK